MPVTRATVAAGEQFDDDSAGVAWLDDLAKDQTRRKAAAEDALAVLNRALEALREVSDDAAVSPVALGTALSVRVGFGTGEQLADSSWTAARELPSFARHHDLDRQRKVALRLSGREPEAEEPG